MIRGAVALAILGGAAGLAGQPARLQAADDGNARYWASLAKDETNMRVGPGREYRINWVYVRHGLPVKVLRVMGGWRLIEDPDGARGWVLAQFLSRTRTALVKGAITAIRANKDGSGPVLWRAAPGVQAMLGECRDGWCPVDVDGRRGFVAQDALWGAGTP
nr:MULTISPECIES: SH3 domain-containing protein [unclassified Novosphingobium]